MILPNLSGRERKIALTAAGVVIGSLIFNLWLYPAIGRWQHLNEETAELNVTLLKMERALKLRGRIEKEYKHYQEQILTTGSNEEEMASLLRELESLSRPFGLYISNIKPLPINDQGFYKKYTVRLEAEGELITLAKFLYSLRTSPQLLKVERLQLEARKGSDLLRANFLVTKVSVRAEKKGRKE